MATQNEEARAAIEGVDLDDEAAKLSDKLWSMACWLLADLAEHPAKDDVRAARSMTDAYLYAMTALDSVVSLVYTMPASRQECTVRVNHLTVRSNVADNDPRLEVITLALRGADETMKSAHRAETVSIGRWLARLYQSKSSDSSAGQAGQFRPSSKI